MTEPVVEPCPHPGFAAEVDVIRLDDVGAFTMDVRVKCQGCGEAFTFVGVEAGLSSHGPRCSIDGTELHVPIAPVSARLYPAARWGFTVAPVGPEPSPDASQMHEIDPDVTQPSRPSTGATDPSSRDPERRLS